MLAEMYGEHHQEPFEAELNARADTVTSPVYKAYPVMESYYATDSE